MIIILLGAGLALLCGGAELLVRGSVGVAARLGVPSLLIGLTIVAFGTSAPELVVSVQAGLGGYGDIAAGNVIGSNIFNIAVILGVTALLRPLWINRKILRFDMPICVGAAVLSGFFLRDSILTRPEGGILFLCLCVYMYLLVFAARREKGFATEVLPSTAIGSGIPVQLLLIVAGLAALVFGSRYFIKGQ